MKTRGLLPKENNHVLTGFCIQVGRGQKGQPEVPDHLQPSSGSATGSHNDKTHRADEAHSMVGDGHINTLRPQSRIRPCLHQTVTAESDRAGVEWGVMGPVGCVVGRPSI